MAEKLTTRTDMENRVQELKQKAQDGTMRKGEFYWVDSECRHFYRSGEDDELRIINEKLADSSRWVLR